MTEKYLALTGRKHTYTSDFHPRTNSKVECTNRTLGNILSKFANGAVRRWDSYQDQALLFLRTRVHETTKTTPFEPLYGVSPRLPTWDTPALVYLRDDEDWSLPGHYCAEELKAKGKSLEVAQERTRSSQAESKKSYDREMRRDHLPLGS